jgi:hypothetical protein
MMVNSVCMRKWVLSLFFCLGILACASAQEFRFTTNLSNNRVAVDEPFQIQFLLENAPNVSSFQPPALNDFEVMQGPSQVQGQSIFNGKRSEYVALIYVLQPKRTGNFTIPGASARVNGNMVRSNPVNIEVVRGAQGAAPPPGNSGRPQGGSAPSYPGRGGADIPEGYDDVTEGILRKGEDVNAKLRKNIFLRVEVDKTSVYEGEQLTATYKLYTRLPTNSSVTKVPAFKGFSAKDIELPNPPQATTERLNGELFKVFTIRKTLLFPLQSGTLELDPVEVDNQVRLVKLARGSDRRRSRDVFEDFFNDRFGKDPFNDPFFDDFFNRPEVEYEDVPYKIQSTPVKITVKPRPVDTRPASYSGAVGKFKMEAVLDKNTLTTDDALNLKVTISGQGNVNLLNAPKVETPPAFEKYDPKVSDNIEKNSNPLSGSRQFEFPLMPLEAGDYTIPPVEFSYFDPATRAYKVLRSAPFSVKVNQGKLNKRDKEDFGIDKNVLAPLHKGNLHWTKDPGFILGSPWYWVWLLLPLLLLAAGLLYRRRLHYRQNNAAMLKHRNANKVALKRLELAARYLKEGKDKAFYEETSRAVWGYLSHKLQIPFADLSKQLVQDRLAGKHINGQNTAQLFELLDNCEMALYTPMHSNDKMQGTYQHAVKVISNLEEELRRSANAQQQK